MQRYKFNTRVRNSGESIATYVAALRTIAEHCGYGDTLKEMLRDRLVCGVNHEAIQRKLLSEKDDLTYEKAYSIAQSIETAERDSKNLKGGKSPVRVNYQSRGPRTPKPSTDRDLPKHGATTITCYRCGGPHLAPECKFKDVECLFCKKKGHLARVCKAKARAKGPPKPKPSHYVETEQEETPVQDAAYGELYTLRDSKCDPITMDVTLNNVCITMELDTGASASIINESTYRHIQDQGEVISLQPSLVKLRTYTGQDIPILGSATLQARYGKHLGDVVVQVVAGDGPNLLGRDLIHTLQVDLGSIHATMATTEQAPLQ